MSCCCETTTTTDTTTAAILEAATRRIYVNQVGVEFTLTFKDGNGDLVDLTNATQVRLLLEDPDGNISEIDLTPEPDVDESDGVLTYETVETDLSVAGRWRYQGVATVGIGSPPDDIEYRTEPMVGFNVYPNLT